MNGAAQRPRRFLGGAGRSQDYVLTFATEFGILASSLAVFKLAAMQWDTAGFGAYVLARRTISMLQLPLLLGLAVAVTRYVAMAHRAGQGEARATYFLAALGVVGVGLGLATLGLIGFAPTVGFVLFGDRAYAPLVRALSLAVAGIVLHGVAYGELRGRLAMRAANALQAVNLGLVPVSVLAIPGLTVTQTVTLTGGAWCVIAGVTAAAIVVRSARVWEVRALGAAARELLRYGAPRVPGDLALGALFTLPATVAAHRAGMTAAGFVGLGMSLLSMIGSLFAPIGHILLPAVSRMAVVGSVEAIRQDARRVVVAALALTTVIVVTLEIAAASLLRAYLGSGFASAVPVIRLVMVGAFPHVLYVILRNVLDAVHVRPYNAKNLLVAVVTFLGATFVPVAPGGSVPLGVVVALFVLGWLTLRDTLRVLRQAERQGAASLQLDLETGAQVQGARAEGLIG